MSAAENRTTFAVTYVYGGPADVLAARRPEHRTYLGGLVAQGHLLASGPFDDAAAPGALLIFAAEDAAEVERLSDEDPLVRHGVVTERTVRPWKVVLGRVG
ncbi:YciI family protein [Kocuria aegyptia]|uniref:YciI family protein n=1 Tax=Kocuria aegyptia TaxID=330943 RepID=A0ABN2K3Z2_9MICC